jgi:dTDP-4-dehydrorhamnose 3,5-epimerase|tara:strand:+ start:834 stop:1232 length:399 start_codon:yes stop_codon:yes gene_type:complete
MSLNKIKTYKLKVIKNKKGDILKYLSVKNNYFIKFGECYFNEIKKNQTKGWNYHKYNQCLLSVPFGKVEFTFTLEPGKKTKKIIIGKKNHSIIVMPPKIWFKFRSLEKLSLVANTLNFPHKDKEGLKIPIKI